MKFWVLIIVNSINQVVQQQSVAVYLIYHVMKWQTSYAFFLYNYGLYYLHMLHQVIIFQRISERFDRNTRRKVFLMIVQRKFLL